MPALCRQALVCEILALSLHFLIFGQGTLQALVVRPPSLGHNQQAVLPSTRPMYRPVNRK